MLTQARLKRLLDYDPVTGVFTWRISRGGKAYRGSRAGSDRGRGYRRILIDSKIYSEHRLAWFYIYGAWPPSQIDHVNRNTSNNAISELRLATPTQNQRNKANQKNNTSGYKGVSYRKDMGRYDARIRINKRLIHLGFFDTPQSAHAAYVAAAKQHFGSYARFT